MNRLLVTLSILVILFAACKKSDSTTSAEEDLRSGIWRRTSGKISYKDPITHGDSLKDYTLADSPCRKDNALLFKEGTIGIMDHGSLHCNSAEGNTQFYWEVSKDEKHLSLYGVADYFPINDVDADILTRTLGYLTIRYRVVSADPLHSMYDTVYYTDVLRR
jgi:hypothetical protein